MNLRIACAAVILVDALQPAAALLPLKSSFVTPAAADFAKSFAYPGIGPSYPKAWTWDLRLPLDHQPRPATPAMNLKPKIEQIRGGKVIATWDRFSTITFVCNIPSRMDNPDSAASHACGGPFSYNLWPAWRPGDRFKVYPAVYKDSFIA